MKTFYLLAVLFIPILSGCKKEDPNIVAMSQQRGYDNWFIGDFRCGLFVPPSYDAAKKYPLIIYLHGHTDTTTWNLEWYNEPVLSQDPCIVLTPKCPREEIYGWGDSWDPRYSPMMLKTFEMLEMVEEALSLDYDRFYVYGTSMGGFGTYGILQKNPDMFAAAYVVCGGGNPDMADILAGIPFWIFHGSADPVVSVEYARDMYQAVKAAGGTTIRYTEYEGVAHNAWDYTTDETTLIPWLLAQRRGSIHGSPDGLAELSVSLNNLQQVIIHWEYPSGNSNPDNAIWFVRIYRDNELFDEIYSDLSTYTDSTILEGQIYKYRLSVVNYHFKESVLSEEFRITAP